MALILRCTSAWEMQLWGQRLGGRQRLWPPVGGAVLLPETLLMGGMWVGTLSPLALGLSIPPPPPTPPPICKGLHKRPANTLSLHCFSQNPAFTLPASELLLVLFFFLRLFCPRLRIRETTEKPTPMQAHEGLFTSSSLCPSTPDIAEQGLGPRGGF